ncbi:MAG TPA: methyltransferase domain-containing protein, partial [Thermoanaerobaculia bacterium]|nr:methyltransferase domain-containing protein [Thermoanaerobaculia bacterium]
MAIAVLFPSYDHPAIEERYASWQAELRLRSGGAHLYYYPAGAPARDVAAGVEEEYALIVTDPLILAPHGLAAALQSALGDADGAIPVSNVPAIPAQNASVPSVYMTLRELDLVSEEVRRGGGAAERVVWGSEDPSVFLCRTEMLDDIASPIARALEGRQVAIVRSEYVHRWSSMRGQVREDLLARIPTEARSILEFGCGEGSLGYALKQRQPCRVAGIELDPDAAAIAKKRIDVVYQGDAAEIVAILSEQFEWIIGGDIVEHLVDPWSFLTQLRRISTPSGHLLLSLPNLASAS